MIITSGLSVKLLCRGGGCGGGVVWNQGQGQKPFFVKFQSFNFEQMY